MINRNTAADAARRLDPRQESGEYRSVISPDAGTYNSTTLNRLGRRRPSREQQGGDAFFGNVETAPFVVLASELGATRPKVGDFIVDAAGVLWSVQHIDDRLYATRYVCTCTRADL